MSVSLVHEIMRAVVYAGVALVLVSFGQQGLWLFFGTVIYGLVASNFLLSLMMRVQALYSPDEGDERT